MYSKHEESIKQSHSDEEIRNLEKQIQTNEETIASLNQTLSIKEDELRRIKDEKKHLEKALEDERVQIISQSTKFPNTIILTIYCTKRINNSKIE